MIATNEGADTSEIIEQQLCYAGNQYFFGDVPVQTDPRVVHFANNLEVIRDHDADDRVFHKAKLAKAQRCFRSRLNAADHKLSVSSNIRKILIHGHHSHRSRTANRCHLPQLQHTTSQIAAQSPFIGMEPPAALFGIGNAFERNYRISFEEINPFSKAYIVNPATVLMPSFWVMFFR